jgi:hypothetical protein
VFNRKLNRRQSSACGIVLALALFGLLTGRIASRPLWAGGNMVPAQATFRDLTTDRMRSDSTVPSTYKNDDRHVNCWASSNYGGFVLRTATVSSTGPPTSERHIVLDFGQLLSPNLSFPYFTDSGDIPPCIVHEHDESPPWDEGLNTCGANAEGDVTILANNLYGKGATCTPVMLNFNATPDFRGNHDFTLEFDCVPITGSGDERVLTASGTAAIGHLYRNTCLNPPQGTRWRKDWIGDFSMPFQLTVQRNP